MAAIDLRFLQQRTDNGFRWHHTGKSLNLNAKPGKPLPAIVDENENGPDLRSPAHRHGSPCSGRV